MEAIDAVLFGLLVIATLGYSISAHSLAAIARKTGQSNTMEILAWIPVLKIVPALAVGGGSVGSFLLGSLAILAANAALFLTAHFLGNTLGGVLMSVGLAATGLLCSAYLARICWNTAAARNLPSWFGLLVAVPGISFFVYPFMALHDGWIHPHKLGPLIGSFFCSWPSFRWPFPTHSSSTNSSQARARAPNSPTGRTFANPGPGKKV